MPKSAFPMLPWTGPHQFDADARATHERWVSRHASTEPVSLEHGHRRRRRHRHRRHWQTDPVTDFDDGTDDSEYEQPNVPKDAMVLAFKFRMRLSRIRLSVWFTAWSMPSRPCTPRSESSGPSLPAC